MWGVIACFAAASTRRRLPAQTPKKQRSRCYLDHAVPWSEGPITKYFLRALCQPHGHDCIDFSVMSRWARCLRSPHVERRAPELGASLAQSESTFWILLVFLFLSVFCGSRSLTLHLHVAMQGVEGGFHEINSSYPGLQLVRIGGG